MNTPAYRGAIRLVLFDVDGVLTDGRLHVTGDGEFMKSFHAKDGIAVALLRAHGIRSGILSGRHSAPLAWRAQQLGFDVFVSGCDDKRAGYARIKAEHALADDAIAYVGDDVNDLPVIESVGVSYAPADAHALVKRRVDYVVARVGGEGVAREVAEHVLLRSGLPLDEAYRPLLDRWGAHDVVQ
ncbi:KdsC family phosphatase [Burkholderia oklahomensis]|uniref:3-deoxy-D-manno-octulosonate 8-phosphate phosphatase KdsC n=1 Tax=Burkholderia oklahomensis TaxID=342113 RepID=A0AAI8FL01_9BURK|nr:HAD family hydrolase [Burkholderia oklahomensis]AIO65011.1 phosphatase, YrbI family [Burkholderia oklahomensis]AJX30896.1 3-deoxy-D-manno-octulosonate 8-phosphate phosphatase, YrbI family protein [Burkholderia oklahomensis C6786]AOI41418.1 3-deoxy-D-manno-octulosonate 8-phosphate phosphatase [Burkholderia oklahomensis EO147]AOI45023.1 3-deoxy-D-manno-octulosonate 8-phosphate phosphatase [Burkholderia oklahomensis C6786]KUY63906.1 3-deoxy-D-manno-octulosonate 8-phosphate phosphatase [Burkhol